MKATDFSDVVIDVVVAVDVVERPSVLAFDFVECPFFVVVVVAARRVF